MFEVRSLNKYGANVFPNKTSASMSKKSLSPCEPTFAVVFF